MRIFHLFVVNTQPGDLGEVVSHVGNSWWDLCSCFRKEQKSRVHSVPGAFWSSQMCELISHLYPREAGSRPDSPPLAHSAARSLKPGHKMECILCTTKLEEKLLLEGAVGSPSLQPLAFCPLPSWLLFQSCSLSSTISSAGWSGSQEKRRQG